MRESLGKVDRGSALEGWEVYLGIYKGRVVYYS